MLQIDIHPKLLHQIRNILIFQAYNSSYFLSLIFSKKNQNKTLKRDEEIHLKQILEMLKYNSPSDQLSFFENALKTKYKTLNRPNGGIVYSTENEKIYLRCDFYSTETSLSTIQKSLQTANKYNCKLYFLATAFSQDAKNLETKNNLVTLICGIDLLKFLNNLNALPPKKTEQKTKRKLKQTITLFTSYNLAKGYFKVSIILFILSVFTPLKNYYHLMALFTFSLTIICLISKPEKTKKVA